MEKIISSARGPPPPQRQHSPAKTEAAALRPFGRKPGARSVQGGEQQQQEWNKYLYSEREREKDLYIFLFDTKKKKHDTKHFHHRERYFSKQMINENLDILLLKKNIINI